MRNDWLISFSAWTVPVSAIEPSAVLTAIVTVRTGRTSGASSSSPSPQADSKGSVATASANNDARGRQLSAGLAIRDTLRLPFGGLNILGQMGGLFQILPAVALLAGECCCTAKPVNQAAAERERGETDRRRQPAIGLRQVA